MSILYAKKVPVTGGDTLWANMALAYDNLAAPYAGHAWNTRGGARYRLL
jgi:alpha-ketoglutarate-dependent taurine dioxygenase